MATVGITTTADIFNPQVIGDITTDILFQSKKLLNSPYVMNGIGEVYRDGGSTLTFPYWNTSVSGLVQTQVETRNGVSANKITMGDYTEPVVNKIISFDYSENAMQDILQSANPTQHLAQVVASESELEIQRSLISKAEGTDLLYEDAYLHATAASQLVTVDGILAAKMQWGERASSETPGLFLHSKQFRDLGQTDDFKRLGTATTNNAIVQAQAAQGAVAMVHGCLLYLLDSITVKGGTVSSITRTGQVATVTTTAAHGFKVGDRVVISGATQTEYNGTFVITAVNTEGTTFSYTVTGSPATPATGTPVIAPRYEALLMLPQALNLVIKQAIRTQEHTHAGSPVRTQDFKFRYCTTLRRVQPRRVVRYSTR